jgi:hypothetical protein
MEIQEAKAIRRRLLKFLYARYAERPLEMIGPRDFEDAFDFPDDALAFNMHYLHDSGLVELMMGYHPRMFNAARITAAGIDVVENHHEFNRRFPPLPSDSESPLNRLPALLEQLYEEADLTSLDRDRRQGLQRDIQYLRDEVARPADACRNMVIRRVLEWITEPFDDPEEALPSLGEIRQVLRSGLRESPEYPPPHAG